MSSHAITNLQYDEEHDEVASLNSWLETKRQEALKNPESLSVVFCMILDNFLGSTTLFGPRFGAFQSLWEHMEGIPETLIKALPQPPILRCTEDLEALVKTGNAAYVLLNAAEPRIEPLQSKRHHSFLRISELAETLLEDYAEELSSKAPDLPSATIDSNPNVDKTSADHAAKTTKDKHIVSWCEEVYQVMVSGAANKLATTLRQHGHRCLVLGFDECRYLNARNGKLDADYHPMSILAMQRIITAADHFLLEGFTLWFTFIDTSSSVLELVPRRGMSKSDRLANDKDPLIPYTSIGFDQMIPSDLSSSPHAALYISRLKLYGRPLWSTEEDDTVGRQAFMKLFRDVQFAPANEDHVFAAFSQRVGLELASSEAATRIALEAVRSHMRFLLSVVDRTFIETTVPSEPCLALAAAQVLRPTSEDFGVALQTLVDTLILQETVLDRGVQGELYARILLIMARDKATDKGGPIQDYYINTTAAGTHVQTITLADLLIQLHGDGLEMNQQQGQGLQKQQARHKEGALDGDNEDDASEEDESEDDQRKLYQNLLAAAQERHVNFTHFIHLEESVGNLSGDFLHYLWDRQCAIQCSHNQPVIDIIIITYSGALSPDWDDSKVSTFCIQVKLKESAVSLTLADELVGPRINGRRPCDEVVMLMEFGVESEFQGKARKSRYQHEVATVRPKTWNGYMDKETEPRWCVHVRGHGPTEYPIISRYKQIFDRAFGHLSPWPTTGFAAAGQPFREALSTVTFTKHVDGKNEAIINGNTIYSRANSMTC
ncbi:hypothetical protein CONPUDRAFT_155053 [Coniophora puteana RWD-64-598 SS2]|uniref:Uncharacterized protein n=1 Tax=Coniophora puteana (strain RWD-64-598) TaxID=741705 RepID=A0A5M3MKV2_CONPW|nr:uncharacterized protein CONPUDRAFT_155053 [Coniophora puteana RWD-64-598 SS2]EIW79657.1 hypothetical protein CONPUDRAFT_155053 [Coniophora puteana RWD-64-598 SS2]